MTCCSINRFRKTGKGLALFLLFLGFYVPLAYSADEPVMTANQAKAALLYNFIKHTQWPNEGSFKQFDVVFLGKIDSFYQDFHSIAPELRIRNKAIIVSEISTFNTSALKGHQVLVISSSMNNRLKDISALLVRTGTLLVTDNATDKKLVMINFVYPPDQKIHFEINKSNIVYDGLKISNDVLLYGGSEIEVATLYKEMEFLLQDIKSEVEKNRIELKQKTAEINNKNHEIATLKEQAASNNELLRTQDIQINEQKRSLQSLNNELTQINNELTTKQSLLDQREKAVKQLAVEIDNNRKTLYNQKQKIAKQAQIVAEKSNTVSAQGQTINSQRNIIIAALILLLIFLLLIINRQKKALTKERQLLETRAELIKAHEEAIKAYQSSDRLKNDFLTAISHEMRTPMNGIMGAVQIADNDSLESMSASMKMINQSSIEMINLVDSVLSYVEIQSGQMCALMKSFVYPPYSIHYVITIQTYANKNR